MATEINLNELTKSIFLRIVFGFVVIAGMFFGTAGTFEYWEAWLYLAVLFTPLIFLFFYLIKNAPDLLERRLRKKEKERVQSVIVGLSSIVILTAFILSGFDKRFGWSVVPMSVVIGANLLVFLGYALFAWVLKENRFASRIIEVDEEQSTVTSGPYRIVRHPMYLGITFLYVFSPLALGSYWAMFFSLFIVPILVARIIYEERTLIKELKGYQAYTQKTKYRLFPGFW